MRRRCFAPDEFDAVSVQNVGSTYIIVSWDLPTHSNGILINFSLYCNGALAGVLPLTVISYNTTGLLPFTLYMYMHYTPVGTWCWASSVLQPACPVMYMYTSRDISGQITHTIYPPSLLPPFTFTSSLSLAPPVHYTNDIVISVYLLIRSLTLTSPLAPPHDPMYILLLQLSSLLVEHTAPNIHDSNKYCCLCWSWGLTATTKPTRIVWQIRVHEDWTTYPMEELTASPPYPSWSRT
ncbi:hypothetical protein EMCRGX_G012376 [Ephydatia muelleri]